MVSIAEWLERRAGKQDVAGTIPDGGTCFHSEYFAYFPLLTADHTNEIKHDIHQV